MVATSDFYQLIDALKADSANSLGLFMPEITLSVFIALFLAVRLVTNKLDLFWVALAGAVVGLISSNPLQLFDGSLVSEELFTGLLVHDGLTVAIRSILMLFLVLFLIFTKISGVPDKEDGADVYSLVFGSTLGMCLMASANHLLIVFMAIEMASNGLKRQTLRTTKTSPINPHSPGSPRPAKKSPMAKAVYFGIRP